jgi:hypothetical protein
MKTFCFDQGHQGKVATMKRLLLLLGPMVALMGSLGLVVSGSAVVGVLELLTYGNVDPTTPPPALPELQWAVLSAIALVVGLVISCLATVMRNSGHTISMIGRLLYTVAGVLLITGAMPSASGIMSVKAVFRILAYASTTPQPESMQVLMLYAESAMTIGCAVFALSAVLLIVAGTAGFQATPSQVNDRQSPLSVVFGTGAVLVGGIVLLLLMFVWSNGNALETMVTQALSKGSVGVQPSELASHLSGILNKSLFVFGGVATLGLLQLLASIFAPSAGLDSEV